MLIVYVLYHHYLLVFIDYFFVPVQDLLLYRVIFLYQKLFHTFMCSIECTSVQYHTVGTDNHSALLSSSLLPSGTNLTICCQTVGW